MRSCVIGSKEISNKKVVGNEKERGGKKREREGGGMKGAHPIISPPLAIAGSGREEREREEEGGGKNTREEVDSSVSILLSRRRGLGKRENWGKEKKNGRIRRCQTEKGEGNRESVNSADIRERGKGKLQGKGKEEEKKREGGKEWGEWLRHLFPASAVVCKEGRQKGKEGGRVWRSALLPSGRRG